MNSKEYLQQIATTEVIDCTNNDKAKKRIANIFPVGISVIEKDLKILEILKEYIKISDCKFNNSNKSNECIFMLIPDNVEDYRVIKEWLENDK